MKRITLLSACIFVAALCNAQTLNSADPSNLNAPANAQPVPRSSTTEKSANTQTPLIAPPANPVAPIYPGGDVKAAETQRNLILTAAPPSPTQPVQREPLTPVESNNTLNPTRPQRDEASRANPAVGVPTEIRGATPDNVINATKNSSVISATPIITNAKPIPAAAAISTATNPKPSSKENMALRMDASAAPGTTKTAAPVKRTATTIKSRKVANTTMNP